MICSQNRVRVEMLLILSPDKLSWTNTATIVTCMIKYLIEQEEAMHVTLDEKCIMKSIYSECSVCKCIHSNAMYILLIH